MTPERVRGWHYLLVVLVAPTMLAVGDETRAAQGDIDWRNDWELAEGLTMEVDTEGYRYPAHLAFVPDPGAAPQDPLYFVVELKGNIKVVTNDRTVLDFATNFLPNPQGDTFVQAGAAGICLDPVNGYVFATFAYLDDVHVYRNGIIRFESEPGRFGLKARSAKAFVELFKDEVSATDHQIGPCQVAGDRLYVAVGYGVDRSQSQNLHSTLGSILRMTLDFEPVADNPFYQDDGEDTAIDFVWAYGFRNPFGLKLVGERLFATENGGSIDRFNEIERGENYLWAGTDWGIGARAAQVFAPSIGIVHLDFIPQTGNLFPESYRGRFVAAAAGAPGAKGPGTRGRRSVLTFGYDFEKRRISEPPKQLLRYRGDGNQIPVSVALGPDALYFIALLPNSAGTSPVYKIRYDPAAGYPHRLDEGRSPQALINLYQCRQCHKIDGRGGTSGPALDAALIRRLTSRLNAPDYRARIAEIDKIESEPFAGFREARRDILAVSGEARVRRWLPIYLRQPGFDNPEVNMPALGLSAVHAESIARYLIESTTEKPQSVGVVDRLRFAVARRIPALRYRHLVVAFVLGAVVATILVLAVGALRNRHSSGR